MAKKKAPKKATKARTKGGKTRTKPAPKPPKKKPAAKTARTKTKQPAKSSKQPLPRPTITGEEKLFLLFKDDYHARQIFDFLRVETVRELEQFEPHEIVKRLSRPIADSVERIRRRLADKNRYLSGDESYLLDALRGP